MRAILVALLLLFTIPAVASECPAERKMAAVEADAVGKGASQIRWFQAREYDAFLAMLTQEGFEPETSTNRIGVSFFRDRAFIIEAHDDCFLMGTPIPTEAFRQLLLKFEMNAGERGGSRS